MNLGSWVAIGAGVGTAMFAGTGDAWWIGVGVGIGAAMGAAFQKKSKN